jgi:hypothetical protein
MWRNDSLSWPDVAKGALGWAIGITLYVIALRFMTRTGVTSAEMQTAVWFAMTIIGVVIFSGKFFAGRGSSRASRCWSSWASVGCWSAQQSDRSHTPAPRVLKNLHCIFVACWPPPDVSLFGTG